MQTVKMKGEAENTIQDCMRQISDRLPDFAVYQCIYPDPVLGSKLAEAYRDVIIFARQVTSTLRVLDLVRNCFP